MFMDVMVKNTFTTILERAPQGVLLLDDFEIFFAQCCAVLSLDDLDDQVAEFLVALESSRCGVQFFLQLATGATETVDLASTADFMDLLGSQQLAAGTVSKMVFADSGSDRCFLARKCRWSQRK